MTGSGPRPLALVTGGWRRIGAAIACRLAGAGYDLALHAHHAHSFDAAFADELAQMGARVFPVATDLGDLAAVESLIPVIVDAAGRVPVLLVNCASVFRDDGMHSLDASGLDLHFRVNCHAPVLLTRALAAALAVTQTPGAAVQIIDQRVRNPVPDQISYTLSKQALHASTRTLARALAPCFRVNAVAPGLTLPTDDYDADQWDRLRALMPLDRLSTPDDIADAVLHLATARSTTGETLFVDSGAHLESYPRDFVYMGR
ncbi:SDR family oxidoreductase [Novosphingobium acidiphilum]|uniref:SDR family oxidoreductase n=1 Tax=Novosphingobium acidiphilum TaxID=505248 RepID=UPI0003FD9118|nr:SDR family oxidoreductase [Novosphingobium acidiphilum]